MNYKNVSLCFFLYMSANALFEHDRAVVAYQAGNYVQASTHMNKAVTRTPTDPCCLYDAGVVAYKNNDLKQADAYLSAVTQLPHVDNTLREKAHFNRAKVYEKRGEYQQALEQYTRVLQINPDNYKAKEEKARLEKLLEQKKQEQQQEQKQEQQHDQQDQSSDKDTKQDKKQQGDTSANTQQRNDQRSEKADKSKTDDENTQKKDEKQEPFGNEQNTKDKRQQAIDKQVEHTNSAKKEDPAEKSIAQKQSDDQEAPSAKKMDIMLERILAEQEKNDACFNKKMMKATVKQNMAGRNDQNCW